MPVSYTHLVSPGHENSYTLETIKEKRLMPVPQPENNYYRFGGWFVDTDGDGVLNNGETLLPQDYRFTAAAVITAHFEENPDAWIHINFEAGSHGSINAGQPLTPVSYTHLQYDMDAWSSEDFIEGNIYGIETVSYTHLRRRDRRRNRKQRGRRRRSWSRRRRKRQWRNRWRSSWRGGSWRPGRQRGKREGIYNHLYGKSGGGS